MTTRRWFLNSTLVSALLARFGLGELQAKTLTVPGPQPEPSRPPRQTRWVPQKTWVFAVGVLTYPEGEAWPQAGRRDAVMLEQLRESGVPKEQMLFLRDKGATYQEVRQRFAAFLGQAPQDATLWFYFAGHGSKGEDGIGSFVLYDRPWSIPDVLAGIEKHFRGTQALLFADCCYSGELGLSALLRAGHVAYAVLTSSLSSAESTGAWTFTNCLIDGLKGQVYADQAGDGWVDLLELASHTEWEMAMNDGQLSTFVTANGFDPRMDLAKGAVREHPRIGDYVSAKAKDQKWHPGRLERFKNGSFLVRWVGFDESANEWVREADLKDLSPTQHPPGTKVSVRWKGQWYPAEVLTGRLGLHLIHYEGDSATWDEWVDRKRLRRVG